MTISQYSTESLDKLHDIVDEYFNFDKIPGYDTEQSKEQGKTKDVTYSEDSQASRSLALGHNRQSETDGITST